MSTKIRQTLKLIVIWVGVWSILLTTLPVEQAEAQGVEIVHIVRVGESLAQIARRYGVSYMELARYNGISNPNVLRVGQPVRIPANNTAATPVPPVEQSEAPQQASIAAPTPIQAEVAPTRQVSSPEAQPGPTPSTAETVTVQPRAAIRACGTEIGYSVRRGDSLYGISATYGVSVRTIVSRNHLPSTVIYVGQRLIIPLPTCQ